jgi:hypothetical protein
MSRMRLWLRLQVQVQASTCLIADYMRKAYDEVGRKGSVAQLGVFAEVLLGAEICTVANQGATANPRYIHVAVTHNNGNGNGDRTVLEHSYVGKEPAQCVRKAGAE